MNFFSALLKQQSDVIYRKLEKNKEDVVFHILEKLLFFLSHVYKKTVNENHSVRSEHLSIISLLATMIIFRYLRSRERSVKNTVLLKK